jgi:hypothetical protein
VLSDYNEPKYPVLKYSFVFIVANLSKYATELSAFLISVKYQSLSSATEILSADIVCAFLCGLCSSRIWLKDCLQIREPMMAMMQSSHSFQMELSLMLLFTLA